MTISVASLLNFEFYQGYLWYIKFNGFNVLPSGGQIGDSFPASSVQEELFKISYDTVTIANDFTIMLPRNVSYLGNVTITFYDNGNPPLQVERLLKAWVDEIHENNAFKDLSSLGKELEVYKTNREGNKTIYSKYLVLPPESLVFSPSGGVDIYSNTITLPIIKVFQIHS